MWRWCFWINLPIGFVTFLVVGFYFRKELEKAHIDDKRPSILSRILQLDLGGAAALVPAVVMLLLAVQWGGTYFPWKLATIIGLLCGSGVLVLIFGATQYRAPDKGLLPPRFIKNRDVGSALLYSFFFGASYFSSVPYISLFFQAIQRASAVQAGLSILPLSISAVLSSIFSGILIRVLSNYNAIIIGESALVCVGAGLITTYSSNTPMSHWFGFEVIMGLGVGVGFQAGLVVVQNVLPPTLISQATSNQRLSQPARGRLI